MKLSIIQSSFWTRHRRLKISDLGLQDMRVVAFACRGSSGSTVPDLSLRKEQRVGLARVDGIVVGLLFTTEELNAFVKLRFRDRHFSDTFLDCVYDMMNGHVGACEDLIQMNMVVAHDYYRHRVKSTCDMLITGVSMHDIPKAIYRGTVFSRVPYVKIRIMSEVIRKESIVCEDDYLASDPKDDDNRKAALRRIFRSGWLHTEIRT